ncbi:MAG TPA: tetratricopeptide repeat protein [Gemmatimonadaceae bacterium]
MRSALLTACVAAGLLVTPPHLGAQDRAPDRPNLETSVDTNDAYAYYRLGLAKLDRDPKQAAHAFYWAARINPGLAEAYYARRVALLLQDPRRLVRYWEGDKHTVHSKEIQHIDSLEVQALGLNPFLYHALDQRLFRSIVHEIALEATRGSDDVQSGEIEYEMNRYISTGPLSLRAWIAYGEGRFDDALDLYAKAIKQAKHKASLRTDRARIFFQLNRPDSALAEFTQALDEMRKADKKDLVYVYESKALTEYSIAMVQQRLGNDSAARDAFGRALEEDLSYFPAHLQLGFMALGAKDTTTALSEMDLAVQIKGDDPWLRYVYGFTLNATGKYPEAETQLRKAVELDSVFAAPHFGLAQALEGQARTADALAEYHTFLALASRTDLRRAEAEKHVAQIGNGK